MIQNYSEFFTSEIVDSIGFIRLCREPQNDLTIEMMEALIDIHNVWSGDAKIRGVIITSSIPGFFSSGLDIDSLLKADSFVNDHGEHNVNHGVINEGKSAIFAKLFDMAIALYGFSKPHISMLNGHAIAGGAILAALSDFRLMANGPYRVSFPETKIALGLPLPFLKIIEEFTGSANLRKVALLGESFKSKQALEVGIVDYLFDEEDLERKTVRFMNNILKYPDKSFRITKMEMRKNTLVLLQESKTNVVAMFKNFFDRNFTEALHAAKEKRRPRFDFN